MASMGPAGFSSYGGWVGAEHLLIPAEMLRRTPYTVSWEGSFSIGPGNPDQRPSPSSAAAATASSPSWAHSGGPSWAYSSGGGGGAGVSGRAVMPHGVTTRWGCAASSPPPHTCCVCSGLLSHAMCLRLLRGVTAGCTATVSSGRARRPRCWPRGCSTTPPRGKCASGTSADGATWLVPWLYRKYRGPA